MSYCLPYYGTHVDYSSHEKQQRRGNIFRRFGLRVYPESPISIIIDYTFNHIRDPRIIQGISPS